MKVEQFLREEKIRYTKTHHGEAFTAQEVAATSHIPGDRLAKAVVLRAGDDFVMAVCPATRVVDLNKMEKALGSPVRLANEGEMERLFLDTELGAEPPFGDLYGIPTYVDKSLSQQDEIDFQAGTHTDTISMAYRDFEKASKAIVADFASHL